MADRIPNVTHGGLSPWCYGSFINSTAITILCHNFITECRPRQNHASRQPIRSPILNASEPAWWRCGGAPGQWTVSKAALTLVQFVRFVSRKRGLTEYNSVPAMLGPPHEGRPATQRSPLMAFGSILTQAPGGSPIHPSPRSTSELLTVSCHSVIRDYIPSPFTAGGSELETTGFRGGRTLYICTRNVCMQFDPHEDDGTPEDHVYHTVPGNHIHRASVTGVRFSFSLNRCSSR